MMEEGRVKGGGVEHTTEAVQILTLGKSLS